MVHTDETNNNGHNGHKMLTTKEVADVLGIHPNTVRRWSDLGLLKTVRISCRGDRRFRYDDITSFLDSINRPDGSK
jgi:excisionase family DNA binding protein